MFVITFFAQSGQQSGMLRLCSVFTWLLWNQLYCMSSDKQPTHKLLSQTVQINNYILYKTQYIIWYTKTTKIFYVHCYTLLYHAYIQHLYDNTLYICGNFTIWIWDEKTETRTCIVLPCHLRSLFLCWRYDEKLV